MSACRTFVDQIFQKKELVSKLDCILFPYLFYSFDFRQPGRLTCSLVAILLLSAWLKYHKNIYSAILNDERFAMVRVQLVSLKQGHKKQCLFSKVENLRENAAKHNSSTILIEISCEKLLILF